MTKLYLPQADPQSDQATDTELATKRRQLQRDAWRSGPLACKHILSFVYHYAVLSFTAAFVITPAIIFVLLYTFTGESSPGAAIITLIQYLAIHGGSLGPVETHNLNTIYIFITLFVIGIKLIGTSHNGPIDDLVDTQLDNWLKHKTYSRMITRSTEDKPHA